MITLIPSSLSITILLGRFFISSTNSYLCSVWSERYFHIVISIFLWSNPSSLCFLFNHNIPSLSTAVFIYTFCMFLPCILNIFIKDQLQWTDNKVLVLLFFVFLFHSQYFCCYDHFHQVLLQVFRRENINHSYNVTHCTVLACVLV